MKRYAQAWPLLLAGVAFGCSKSPLDLIPAGGVVKFADGSLPECQVRVIRFEPVADADGRISPRAATAEVQSDGTFQLMTLRPGDGAMAGDYKPVLMFFKSYLTRESIVPSAYSDPKKTPLSTVSIRIGNENHFDLAIEKRRE